jgi:hypothetical protein
MRSSLVLFLLALGLVACGVSRAPQTGNNTPSESTPDPVSPERVFLLSIDENRVDSRRSPATGEIPSVEQERVLKMFGRARHDTRNGAVYIFYADSLELVSRKPFEYSTFMSADTMYKRTREGPSGVNRRDSDEVDLMLKCLFGGPAVRVYTDACGAPVSTEHPNETCRSGEYSHINAPVTLSVFFFKPASPGSEQTTTRWRDSRLVPSFSGVGFHPSIELLYRVVDTGDELRRISVTADTTVRDLSFTMKNGEEVTIVSHRFRVGGTLSTVRDSALPLRGELRVREELTMLRKNAGGQIVDKLGEYTIRFSLDP